MRKENLVILSLGSNIENRKAFLGQAISALNEQFQTKMKESSIYETEPWGFDARLSFLNCCVSFKSSKKPKEILQITQFIEQKTGRIKKKLKKNYQSRTLDIDILFIGDFKFKDEILEIPHPHLYSRNFVLKPLLELFPNFVDPVSKKTIQEIIRDCNDKNSVILYKG